MNYFLLTLSLLFFFACTDLEETNYEFSLPEFELRIDYSGKYGNSMKKYLISLFTEVALGSEYGDQRRILKKWVKPMIIGIEGPLSKELEEEFHSILLELNSLFTDGFRIALSTGEDEPNFIIYIGSKNDPSLNVPFTRALLKANDGLFSIKFNQDHEIESGKMFVNTGTVSNQLQFHILREELTQSLGLGNDLLYDRQSIFYTGDSRTTTYSERDVEIIRLLYHPSLFPGLSESSVTSILKNLLRVN